MKTKEKYKKYNWVHTYPNLAAQVVAIYFAKNDFEKAIKLLWEMNGADMAKLPTLDFDDIDERDLKVFAEAWTKLVTAGAVTNNPETEAAIRKDFGMPELPAVEAAPT